LIYYAGMIILPFGGILSDGYHPIKLAVELERLRQVKGPQHKLARSRAVKPAFPTSTYRNSNAVSRQDPRRTYFKSLRSSMVFLTSRFWLLRGYLKEPRGEKRRAVPRDVETIAKTAQFSNSEWEEVREFMTFLAAKKHRGSK